MATNYVFKRIEKKYLMTKEQHEALLERIAPYMTRDQYGLHTICNLYFDTDDFDLVSRSIEKPVYKEKLRIRSYGIPNTDSTVFIELKKKYKGIVYKRRIETTLSKAQAFLTGQYQAVQDEQIAREIQYFLEFYHAYPRVYIAYDREAYFCEEDDNLRMTFDRNIRSRQNDLFLEAGDEGDLLLEDSMRLLEIKAAGAVPLWLADALSELKIYPVSFSKYGNVYKQIRMKEKMEEIHCKEKALA